MVSAKRKLTAGILLLLFGVCVWITLMPSGIKVEVKNVSGGTITEFKIMYNGGTRLLPSLKDKDTFKVMIDPAGESGLEVRFFDSKGAERGRKMDVYLEHDYKGVVFITVHPNARISFFDATRLGPF